MTPAEQVIKSLREEPDKWTQGEFALIHDNGTEIWTADGLFCLELHIPKRYFSLYEKLHIKSAIKEWERRPLPNFNL